MIIKLKEITVRELTDGYIDNGDDGVFGYSGKLDIRPPFQREFIYKDKQRDAVITTVKKGYPLNVMYWAVRKDGTYEIIDGQQRTISLGQFINGDFHHDMKYFHNLKDEDKNPILDYRLMIYICDGTEPEKLEWFKTINIAGETLTEQELNNAVFAGPWLSDAKRYFSKRNCPAYGLGNDYINARLDRQGFLEVALDWISKGNIVIYMANHQHDPNASALWRYFQDVITWVQTTFSVKRAKFMKGLNWGKLYDQFKDEVLDAKVLEDRIRELLMDDDVENKRGIYVYVLTGDEKFLGIRAFSDSMKIAAYERQNGICVKCGNHFEYEDMEGDHIVPWSKGGKTVPMNCQMLCRMDNGRKSGH